MSAKHLPTLTAVDFEELACLERSQLKQLKRETIKNMDGLEQDIKDAKRLVRQTQGKVEELAISFDKIEEEKKER
jgi:hypothetical protein